MYGFAGFSTTFSTGVEIFNGAVNLYSDSPGGSRGTHTLARPVGALPALISPPPRATNGSGPPPANSFTQLVNRRV